MFNLNENFLILCIPTNWMLKCRFQPTLAHTRSSVPLISQNHSCGSLGFDVSLRQLREKTGWIVRERKERKITFSLNTGEKSSTLHRPWEPSGAWLSVGPPKKQHYKPRKLWENSGVLFNGQRPCHVLIRFSFSLNRERSHCFDVV